MAILDVFKKDEGAKKKTPAKKKSEPKAKTEKVALKEKTVAAAPVAKKESAPASAQKGDTKNAYKVLVRPVITEKATALGALNKYAFEVALDATKNEVRKAIFNLYHVMPTNVTVMVVAPKKKFTGRRYGKTVKWKKAVVTLKKGDSITVYEGV